MNKSKNYDIAIIGSGPGGQKAAIQGAKLGKKVAMIEREHHLGGSCVYQGTIPSKTLLEAALTLSRLKRDASIFNFSLQANLEVATMMHRLENVLNAHKRFISSQVKRNKIDVYHGIGKLIEPEEIEIFSIRGTTKRIRAKTIVIATGSRPRTPPDIPIDHEHILDSDSILSMIYLPQSLTVLGGGVVATEYASIFALLGVKVTMIDRAPRPLMFLDSELISQYLKSYRDYGGEYRGSETITSVEWDGVSQVVTILESGDTISSDKMLAALGRVANVETLGLQEVGIAQDARGHLVIDQNYRTSIPNIYAVGDVIGSPALASCAMEQGRRAICDAFSVDPGRPFEDVPMGIYAVPEISSVGLNEAQAREKFGDILVGRAAFDEVARGHIAGIQNGLLKIISDSSGDRILGVQIVGEGATELIHMGAIAIVNDNGIRVFLENILNFPTLGEAYRVAALDINNQILTKSKLP